MRSIASVYCVRSLVPIETKSATSQICVGEQRRGGRLDHHAERRATGDPQTRGGRVEQRAHAPDLRGLVHHRQHHAAARERPHQQHRLELRRAAAPAAAGSLRTPRRPSAGFSSRGMRQVGDRLVAADVERADHDRASARTRRRCAGTPRRCVVDIGRRRPLEEQELGAQQPAALGAERHRLGRLGRGADVGEHRDADAVRGRRPAIVPPRAQSTRATALLASARSAAASSRRGADRPSARPRSASSSSRVPGSIARIDGAQAAPASACPSQRRGSRRARWGRRGPSRSRRFASHRARRVAKAAIRRRARSRGPAARWLALRSRPRVRRSTCDSRSSRSSTRSRAVHRRDRAAPRCSRVSRSARRSRRFRRARSTAAAAASRAGSSRNSRCAASDLARAARRSAAASAVSRCAHRLARPGELGRLARDMPAPVSATERE